MADVKRIVVKPKTDCNCGKTFISLEFSFPIDKSDLAYFTSRNYRSVDTYTNIGIFYVEDMSLAAIGPFGGNKLQIKCKKADCEDGIVRFEGLLRAIR